MQKQREDTGKRASLKVQIDVLLPAGLLHGLNACYALSDLPVGAVPDALELVKDAVVFIERAQLTP